MFHQTVLLLGDSGDKRPISSAHQTPTIPFYVNFPATRGAPPPRFAGEDQVGIASRRGGDPFPERDNVVDSLA